MFIGEEHVPFDTRSIHSGSLLRPMYSPPKIQNGGTIVVIVEFSLEGESLVNSENDDDIPILAAVATYQ